MDRKCLRCDAMMTRGRIFDNPSNTTMISLDGKPAPLMWMAENDNISFFRKFGTHVRAFMCSRCSYIELVGEDHI